MKKIIFLTMVMMQVVCFAQLEYLQQIYTGSRYYNYDKSYVFQKSDSLFHLYYDNYEKKLEVELSLDYGKTWKLFNEISGLASLEGSLYGFDFLQRDNGDLLIAVLLVNGKLSLFNYNLTTNTFLQSGNTVSLGFTFRKIEITIIDESTVLASVKDSGNSFSVVTEDNGVTWSEKQNYPQYIESESPQIAAYHNALLYSVFTNENTIELIISEDLGKNWIQVDAPFTNANPLTNASIYSDSDNLYIVFEESVPNQVKPVYQKDVCYIVSTNHGTTWGEKQNFTRYVGQDSISTITCSQGNLITAIRSNRPSADTYYTYIGYLTKSIDPAPPIIYSQSIPRSIEFDEDFPIQLFVNDESGINSVTAEFNDNLFTLFDDGSHNDSLAGDNIYGATITGIPSSTVFPPADSRTIAVNNISLPVNKNGILADTHSDESMDLIINIEDGNQNVENYSKLILLSEVSTGSTGKYNGKTFLFSGGFILTGYSNSNLWGNAVATVLFTLDYNAGPVGSLPNDENNLVYVVKSNDPPFGASWQDWQKAVENGAYFYDGDNDGYYNPVDKNKNGFWDSNEDKPDILYDATLYTVYNDGVPASERRWNTINPMGIEIRQSVFASGRNSILQDVFFVRYSLVYKGLNSPNDPDSLEEVIFSLYTDDDIGGTAGAAGDDKVGCDTTLQAGYAFNDGEDDDWGSNPPAVFKTIVQGPLVKSTDKNSTGYNKKGPDLGFESFHGYSNLGMTTYTSPQKSIGYPVVEPHDHIEARNFALGLNLLGEPIDPCNFEYGGVFGGVDCATVNDKYWFSGDPVTNIGWLYTKSRDVRNMINTGPFTLQKNEAMDIIVAYVVGQGTDALNSITVARETTQYVHEEYERNFSTIVGVEDKPEEVVNTFSLSQNYPNPFNPTTSIQYQVSSIEKVSLIVYDILGRQVKTLVNEIKSPGNYEVNFDASKLASGVYFYRLESSSFNQTKKMMVVK